MDIVDPSLNRLETNERVNLWSRRYEISVQELFELAKSYVIYLPHLDVFCEKDMVFALNEIVNMVVKHMGLHWPGYKAFYEDGTNSCDQLLTNCKFNDREFPCYSVDDVHTHTEPLGACFKLKVRLCKCVEWEMYTYLRASFVCTQVPNAISTKSSKMPRLEFQLNINFEHLFDNYFASIYLHFSNQQLTLFDDLYHIPGGTTAFAKVKVKWRQLLGECIGKSFSFDQDKHRKKHQMILE